MSIKVPDNFDEFDATLSLQDPIMDYERLLTEKLKVDALVSNEMMRKIWDKIATGAREALWMLLFESEKHNVQNLDKAARLLKLYKDDACFYGPWPYNEWIVKLRDELLDRRMLEFWKNVVVANELGPAWSRDSDLFDDTDDTEPAKFYEFAGSKAPWLEKTNEEVEYTTSSAIAEDVCKTLKQISKKTSMEDYKSEMKGHSPLDDDYEGEEALRKEKHDPSSSTTTANVKDSPKPLKQMCQETPLEDYKYNMEAQSWLDPDDEEAYKKIFAEAREMLWQLLFKESTFLDVEKFEKAAALLRQYKHDACLYSPYDYNDWIYKVKDELFKHNHRDFWENVIVKENLGLCWAQDSDYFDDMDDPRPMEFYTTGDGKKI